MCDLFIRPEWHERAACRTMPLEAFMPEEYSEIVVDAALAVCADCPVRIECGRVAQVHGEKTGVWGGRWWGKRSVGRPLGQRAQLSA